MMRLVIELIGFAHGKSYGYEEYIFNLLRDFKRNRSHIIASEIIIVCPEDQKEYFRPVLCDGISLFTVKYSNMIGRKYLTLRKENLQLNGFAPCLYSHGRSKERRIA